jgi:hypothetical protein
VHAGVQGHAKVLRGTLPPDIELLPAGTRIRDKRPEVFTADAMVVKESPGGSARMDPTGTGAPSCEVPAAVGAAVLCIN